MDAATSGLKRPYSADGVLRLSKRCKPSDAPPSQRKVSFGRLQETVFFDKKDSSSRLSLGVSVSDSSLSRSSCGSNSSSNFRWEAQQPPSMNGNASWGQISSSGGSCSDSRWEPHQPSAFNGNASWPSRWQCSAPAPPSSSRPNMFLQMLNTQQSALPKVPTRRDSFDNSGEQDMTMESDAMPPPPSHYALLRPMRRASLTNNNDNSSSSNDTSSSSSSSSSSTMPAPVSIRMPSLPSRRASPISFEHLPVDMVP